MLVLGSALLTGMVAMSLTLLEEEEPVETELLASSTGAGGTELDVSPKRDVPAQLDPTATTSPLKRSCKPRTTTVRLGTVAKPRDRSSHFEILARRCPGGRVRAASPRAKADPEGTCEASWRNPDDNRSCEVDVTVEGPSHREVRCVIGVTLRDNASRACTP